LDGTAGSHDRALIIGLGVVLAAIMAGLCTRALPQTAAVMLAVPVALTTLFNPKRSLMLLLGIQISLEFTQLDLVNFYLGPMRLRPDDLLFAWVMFLWILSIPDRRDRVETGATPAFILALVIVGSVSLLWGLSAGNDPGHAFFMYKHYPGYLSFFPAAWLISRDKKTAEQLAVLVAAAAVLAGINIALRGFFRVDELVYERSTGLRVQARQAFAVSIGLMFLFSRYLVRRRRAALSLMIPAGVLMSVGLLLSQTRSAWFGTLLGAAAVFLLYTASRRKNLWRALGAVAGMAVLGVVLLVAAGLLLQAAGLMEMQDILARPGSETGNYLTDATFLARAVSWLEILREVGNPAGLIMGKGMGYQITYFRFDYMQRLSFSTVDGSYFQILLNAGIPGVLALVLLYAHVILKSASGALKERDEGRWELLLACFGSMVMLAAGSFFMSVITNYRFTVLFGVLFAIIAVKPAPGASSEDLPAGG
jgi:O-antigen ligase